MSKLEKRIIEEASRRYEKIFPVIHKKKLQDCFTYWEDMVIFWFNTADCSTHIIKEKLR